MEESILSNYVKPSEIQAISMRINKHCEEIIRLEYALEKAQNNNPQFSLNQPFDSTKSSMLKTVLVNMGRTYESIRSDLGRIVHAKGVDFENMFPKLYINFETYYTIAISMLNLTYQLQYMKVYCQVILES